MGFLEPFRIRKSHLKSLEKPVLEPVLNNFNLTN